MSTPTKAAEIIREALEYGLGMALAEQSRTGKSHSVLMQHFKDALAILADMEREGEPAKVVTTIKGWVRPAGVDVHGPGYELGSGCGWCEFNEVGQPDHGDQPATLIIGTHPSPTTADAKDSAVDVQGIIRAGDAMANRLKIMETGAGLQAVWSEITKPFRP